MRTTMKRMVILLERIHSYSKDGLKYELGSNISGYELLQHEERGCRRVTSGLTCKEMTRFLEGMLEGIQYHINQSGHIFVEIGKNNLDK